MYSVADIPLFDADIKSRSFIALDILIRNRLFFVNGRNLWSFFMRSFALKCVIGLRMRNTCALLKINRLCFRCVTARPYCRFAARRYRGRGFDVPAATLNAAQMS